VLQFESRAGGKNLMVGGKEGVLGSRTGPTAGTASREMGRIEGRKKETPQKKERMLDAPLLKKKSL